MTVVLASQNAHKLQELGQILSQYGMRVVPESQLGIDLTVAETGSTFEENSLLKAEAVCRASGFPTIADDSGLMVDALNGAPGVFSARYGGTENRTDTDRLQYLLRNMEHVPPEKRTARFVCVITLLRPDGTKLVSRGTCEGRIAMQACGTGGFGYDPVFYVPEAGCTFAEMTPAQKNAISHRANALRGFVEQLNKEKSNADE